MKVPASTIAGVGLTESPIPIEMTPRRIALHEAGHAVAAVLCRVPFVSVSIRRARGSMGRLLISQGRSKRTIRADRFHATTRRDAAARVMVSLGGIAAELIFFGIASAGGLRDFNDAAADAAPLGDDTAFHLRRLSDRIGARLQDHAESIEAVATELLRRRELSAREVRTILIKRKQA